MPAKLEINDYYELAALHKALHVARFARELLLPHLPGSPHLADLAKRTVATLAQMEIERGKPERANDWQIAIDPNGELWRIALRNATLEPELWRRQTNAEKQAYAMIILSPFVVTDETIERFIREADTFAEALD